MTGKERQSRINKYKKTKEYYGLILFIILLIAIVLKCFSVIDKTSLCTVVGMVVIIVFMINKGCDKKIKYYEELSKKIVK